MPPEPRLVPRFAAEPPQGLLPYGRWAQRLADLFRAEVGTDVGEITWFPDRTWHGRTYVPATAPTPDGDEAFGVVSFRAAVAEGGEPEAFRTVADVTDETAERNPDWRIDLNDEVVGAWRGEAGNVAAMTLVWGLPLVPGAVIATAELADLAVDQCILQEGRFTLLAPDDYRGDVLDVKVFNDAGEQLARESPYE